MTAFSQLVARGVLAIGDGYRAKNEELGGDGPIFLRSGYLQDDGWLLDQPDRFGREPNNGFGPKVAQLGDTVITTKGNSLGRVGLANSAVVGSVYSPHLSYWRSISYDEVLPRYLYYWARSPAAQSQVKARSASTDMAPYLSLADQLTLEIDLPSIEQQRAVAGILGVLDDKIELNRHMSETLEKMARTLFKSWFIDFDPVQAKSEGRPTGLPNELSALFPDSFAANDLPFGWERRVLRPTLARSIVRGVTPAYAKEGILVLNQRCIRDGRVDLTKARRHDFKLKRVGEERLLARGDVVINSTGVGTLGRVAQVPQTAGLLTADGHVTIVKPNEDEISANLLGLSLLELEPLIETLGHGSTGQTELSRDTVGELEIVLPTSEVRRAFDEMVIPLRNRADSAIQEADILSGLRDILLPKLISGELRVADAEKRIAVA
ncbi:MAG: restriction endonuclease subunit S [Xanthobacteraceae bacterium]|nr:restriction endonuclease subunit S [Xanthobacteraceae bacterium]